MKKIITKLIYFLLRYIKEDVTSFEHFYLDMEKIANNRFFTVAMEKRKHTNQEPTIEFIGYIANLGHLKGCTPSEVISQFKNPSLLDENKIDLVID